MDPISPEQFTRLHRALESLTPGRWLNDEAVSLSLRQLDDDRTMAIDPITLASHAEAPNTRTYRGIIHAAVDKTQLLLPLCRDGHWALFVYQNDKGKEGCLRYYDSLSQGSPLKSQDAIVGFLHKILPDVPNGKMKVEVVDVRLFP
jgi:Ulp1 family protease